MDALQPGIVADSLFPPSPLFGPVGFGDNVAQFPLGDVIMPARCLFQKKKLFLNVWGEVQQVQELGYARKADPAQSGEVRVVFNNAGSNQPVETDGERQQLRDSGNRCSTRARHSSDSLSVKTGLGKAGTLRWWWSSHMRHVALVSLLCKGG